MHPEGRTKAFPERRGERVPDRGVGGRFLSEQGLGGGGGGGGVLTAFGPVPFGGSHCLGRCTQGGICGL